MILDDIVLLASDTARTKAYLQTMIKEEKLPGFCIVYSDDIPGMEGDADAYQENPVPQEYFDINEPVMYSLRKAGIGYVCVNNRDINSEEMKDTIAAVKQTCFIYSGYGGYLLKEHLFKMGKRFIHVHAGLLPQYRGSTTAYYSVLQEGIFGATAIFLNEGIDEGNKILEKTFPLPGGKVNIDYIYEPYTRARVLTAVLEQYVKKGFIQEEEQSSVNGQTYFIIHPVLKHLALLKLEKEWAGAEK